MKKIITLILLSFVSNLSLGEEIKSYFYIKLVDGDPFEVEMLCIESFGDEFSYGNDSKVFTIEASSKNKLEFIKKIKEAGLEITTSSEKDAFEVRIKKVESTAKEYKINTYIFKEEEILQLQEIFSASIKGGGQDYISVDNADIAKIKVALKKMGYDCKFGEKEIFIKQSEYTFEIKYPDFMPASDILPALEEYAIKTQELMDSFRISITKDKLADLLSNLEAMPLIKEVKLVESNKLELIEKGKTVYKLDIYISSMPNARKLIESFGKSNLFSLEDSFISQERGTMRVEFSISTYNENKEEVLADISSLAKRTVNSLRTRDIKTK